VSAFGSILLPLDGSPEAAKAVGCALWLAQALSATLHVLHATAQPLSGGDALARLHVPGDAQRARVVFHQLVEEPQAAVLDAISIHGVDLVVMSARGASASAGLELHQHLGTVAQSVLERSPVPVLLLPAHYREALPWRSMLAAASGEPSADQTLESAVRLAAELQLELTIVHCEDGPPDTGRAALGAYADAPHHEYPRRLAEIAERGLADSTAEAARCGCRIVLHRGDPAAVLLQEATRLRSSVLALGWHGALATGRALILKRLLGEAKCALLLMRAAERSTARLKLGEEIDGP
jgi:nucleotide-binding universal stress UspA family protein